MMNRDGKGGFRDHPENINKGRGFKGTAISEIIRLILDGKDDTIPNTPKKEIAQMVIDRAKKDKTIHHLRLLLQYHDGMPKQMVELAGKLDIDEAARLRASEMTAKEFKAYLQKHIDEIDKKVSDGK